MSDWAGKGWGASLLSVAVVTVLLASLLPVSAAATSEESVTYAVQAGVYNNTVRLGPSDILSGPLIITGPDPANLSLEDVYVLGLNDTGISPCSNLTVFRSTDGGSSFTDLAPSGVCLPGAAVDAVVLGNGDVVVASSGPIVVRSPDGGAHWSSPEVLGNSTSLPSLALDPTSNQLYLAWTGASGNSTGSLFVATSGNGGVTWSVPASVLPAGTAAEEAELAADGNSVVLTYLEMFMVLLGPPNPPGNGNNSTTPPPPEAPDEALATVGSSDGGGTWRTPELIVHQNLSLLLSAPSVAVSPNGTFALAWTQVNGSAVQNGTFVVVSKDGGVAWSSPVAVAAAGPPVAASSTFGHAAAFDSSGRLFVTWHNYSATNPLGAQLNVAISNRSLDSFATSSFALTFRAEEGNNTQSENLAAGGTGDVFLAWEVFGPWNTAPYGVFVRAVSGEVTGNLTGATGAASISLTDVSTGATVGHVTWEGRPFTLAGLAPDSYEVWVNVGSGSTLAGTIPIVAWGVTSFVVAAIPTSGSAAAPFPYPWVILGVGAVVGGILVSLSYTRLTRDTVLRQKLRSLIFEYIQSEPGASFGSVRDALGLQNGTTSYHLAVLEREGFVRSVVRGRRRHFFPVGGVVTFRDPPLSSIQASILRIVEATPGVGLRELSRAVGREASSVAYSARVLTQQGLLKMVRTGLRLRFYPAPAMSAS